MPGRTYNSFQLSSGADDNVATAPKPPSAVRVLDDKVTASTLTAPALFSTELAVAFRMPPVVVKAPFTKPPVRVPRFSSSADACEGACRPCAYSSAVHRASLAA